MYNNIPTQVRTAEVRLSYANLNQPRQAKPSDIPKYSVSLLIPKSDVNTLNDIKASIEAAAQASQSKIWNGYRPPNIHSIIHDGDSVKDNGKPYGDECKGCWVINASSTQKPRVVHQSNIKVDLDPNDVYSGMYGQVMLNFFGYNTNGKIGVGCGLGPIMKTKDGEALSGGISVEDAFADVGGVAAPQGFMPATPNYAAPGYTPPAPGYQQPMAQPQQQNVTINPLTGQPM